MDFIDKNLVEELKIYLILLGERRKVWWYFVGMNIYVRMFDGVICF